jgi:hypothetical protein
MDPADIAALFYGDEASGPEKAAQLAAALRGDTQLGQLGLLTGDKVLGGVGQSLLQGAQAGQQQLEKAANMRLTKAMEAEKQKTEQQFRQSQEKHMAAQEDMARQQLALGRYQLKDSTPTSPGYIFDPKTGKATPLLDAAPGRPEKGQSANQAEQEWQAFGKDISTYAGRGSLNRENQTRLGNLERLEALIKAENGGIQNLSPQQLREASTALASAISSGSASLGQIEELTPHTMAAKFADFKQKWLNQPSGADAQAFLQNMLETAAREKGVIQKQIHAGQTQKLPLYAPLRGKDAARYNAMLQGAGLNPESFDERGLERAIEKAAAAGGGAAGGGGLSAQDQAAIDWATKNPSDPRAVKILQMHGAGK